MVRALYRLDPEGVIGAVERRCLLRPTAKLARQRTRVEQVGGAFGIGRPPQLGQWRVRYT
jgi:hypothetical protein